MHDVLAHTMSGLVLNLEGARLLASRTDADPRIKDAVERARRLAKTGLDEARRAIGMLRGDSLPGPDEMADLAAEFEADSGVECSVAVTGKRLDLDADASVTLYRIAQEALTNIRRHAHPDRVEIRLAGEDSGTRLIVEDFGSADSGPACDVAAPGVGTGYGLTGMRERAALLGGELTAAATGNGFRVELWIPR
jgi:signal transduction histidine kinase